MKLDLKVRFGIGWCKTRNLSIEELQELILKQENAQQKLF